MVRAGVWDVGVVMEFTLAGSVPVGRSDGGSGPKGRSREVVLFDFHFKILIFNTTHMVLPLHYIFMSSITPCHTAESAVSMITDELSCKEGIHGAYSVWDNVW